MQHCQRREGHGGWRAPARPEQPSQWPMLDLTLPMSSGSCAVRQRVLRCAAPAECVVRLKGTQLLRVADHRAGAVRLDVRHLRRRNAGQPAHLHERQL
jgi:hypothetical protein